MAYTLPAYNAADATWQGASIYTVGDGTNADAQIGLKTYVDASALVSLLVVDPGITFAATGITPFVHLAELDVALPPPVITLVGDVAGEVVVPGIVAASLPDPTFSLILDAAGDRSGIGWWHPHPLQADASFQGLTAYTVGDGIGEDAYFVASTTTPGILYASLPDPVLSLTMDAEGARDRDWLFASIPDPAIPLVGDVVVEYIHAPALAVDLPPPDLPLLFHARERSIYVTVAVALPPPALQLVAEASVEYIHAPSLTVALLPPDPSFVPVITADQDKAMTDSVGPKERGFRHQQMEKINTSVTVEQQKSNKTVVAMQTSQQQAASANNALSLPSTETQKISRVSQLLEQSTIKFSNSTTVKHQDTLRIPTNPTGLAWQQMEVIRPGFNIGHQDTLKTRTHVRQDHNESLPVANPLSWIIHQALKTSNSMGVKWAQMIDAAPGLYWPFYNVPTLVDSVTISCNYDPKYLFCKVVVGFGYPEQPDCKPCYTKPDAASASVLFNPNKVYTRPEQVGDVVAERWACNEVQPEFPHNVIPTRRTYIVIHTISVTRLSDGLPIDVENISLSLDADAWTWGFNANLVGKNALEAVKPSALGEPITLIVAINDIVWHVIVEDWSENRSFGNRSISVSGRGLSAELADPYQLPSSGVTTQNWNVQQLMNEHLPLGSGWTITWATGMADWQVPAGAWSWQNQTPITSIHAIAQQCGMTVVPDTDTRTLHIQPRYKYMPWSFSSQTPDLVIPDSAILSYQRQNSIPAQANAVYVHGSEVGGVIGYCVKDGTAGDKVLTTYNSNLITHSDGAQLVGSRLLAGQYKQPEIRSVTMTMGGSFPLGQIGSLIKMTVENQDHYGIVNSVALQVSASNVRQTLTFGENTTNQWALFKTLLPGDPLLLGTVLGNSADGTVTVGLVDGTAIRARGTDAIGTPVWVRSGRVEGTAPNLTQHPVTIY